MMDFLTRSLARRKGDKEPSLRLFTAETTELVQKAAQLQGTSPLATLALARALTGGILLGGLAKSERNINLQLASDGPLGTVFVDADPQGTVRGYVSKNPDLAPIVVGKRPSVRHGFGSQGFVNVMRADESGRYFRGTVQLKGGEIDDDFTDYLFLSEQVQSVLVLEALQDEHGRITNCVGLLLQALPGAAHTDPIDLKAERERLADGVLYEALKSGHDWIDRVLATLGVVERTELEDKSVSWFCQCSDTRVRAALAASGIDELSDMIAKEGHAEIFCDFCRTRYYFDKADLLSLRDLCVSAALAHKDPSDTGDN